MKRSCFLILLLFTSLYHANAQSITGVWRGKVSRGIRIYNLELKLIRSGDSLTGTSYYFHSPTNYSRFRVKGYFDISGDIVWWDKELIENKGGKISNPNTTPFVFAADFNCPGDDIMKLDGTADKKGDEGKDHEVHLSKVEDPFFKDEWDEVIGDFPYYASVPNYIDSIERSSLAFADPGAAEEITDQAKKAGPKAIETLPPARSESPVTKSVEPPVTKTVESKPTPSKTAEPLVKTETPPVSKPIEPPIVKTVESKPETTVAKPAEIPMATTSAPPMVAATKNEIPASIKAPKTIEDKFIERKKILVTEIPVYGDSIKLNFYDNAQIDGDSITLFLNGKLVHQHILLKAIPFEYKIAVADLQNENELIMVAENLGTIPPNTSLMIVWVNGVRHEARLESSENSSAMIRFTKKPPAN